MSSSGIQFTYDHDPSRSQRDAARWYAGDTDCRRPLVDDREVDFALTRGGDDPRQAAVIILNALASKFAREADLSVGDVSKSLGDVSDRLRQRAMDLQEEITLRALPFFGGRSISGKVALASDTNAVPPRFEFGDGDSYRATQFDEVYSRLDRVGYFK